MRTLQILSVSLALLSMIFAILGLTQQTEKPLEYHYKNFSERDLTLAMKYHGTDSITITETECFFVNADHVKVPVFTDGCIEYLYKSKQKEVRKCSKQF